MNGVTKNNIKKDEKLGKIIISVLLIVLILICTSATFNDEILNGIEKNFKSFNLIIWAAGLTGCLMVKDSIDGRRRDATYGFYINLKVHLIALSKFFPDKKNENGTIDLNHISYLWLMDQKNIEGGIDIPHIDDSDIQDINSVSRQFLDFLAKADNNVPPKGYGNQKWFYDQIKLIEFLNFAAKCSHKHCGKIESIEKLKEYIKEIFDIIQKLSNCLYR